MGGTGGNPDRLLAASNLAAGILLFYILSDIRAA
jgi:hypothetical protein